MPSKGASTEANDLTVRDDSLFNDIYTNFYEVLLVINYKLIKVALMTTRQRPLYFQMMCPAGE